MRLVDRALNALDILSRNMDGMSVTELANQLGIPASSTHRVLASLKGNDLVVQDKHTKKYHPSYRICGIAANIIKSSTLVRNGNPLVKELAEKINQKVDLCVMEHGAIRNIVSSNCGAVYGAVRAGTAGVRNGSWTGIPRLSVYGAGYEGDGTYPPAGIYDR